ncbi:MAG: ABC transporter [Rhodospirillaceae bacterium]|jgi:predicted unusual protein kinase regulating ubiquinone biosynthesis (AarF/ABC1/UbiB family)|nr:ABC transporter [Rhodospirillaceae bacterium]MBT4941016.1 ABC transporter [Rhodospirillaceae bacterium]MBT5940374.1 ABC transporter [Rhodospirillaceae bacterium]MBT7269066.1 ABC transporter [Rhodospirillaceae bacterium]
MANIIKRSAQLFKTAKGVAALRKANTASEKEIARAALANLFADARGVTMKIGQLFSEMEGGSPFDDLAKGVDPYPFSKMQPVLEAGLGKPLSDVFSEIDEVGIAASLGQVHKARFPNGQVVAVKIRYPGIAAAVESEMKIAGMIPRVGPAKKWGMDLEGYKKTLKDNMDRELDYRTEADRQIAYARAVSVSGLVVPTIYHSLCSEAVLVQSWEEGEHLDEVIGWPEDDREYVSRLILKTFFHSLFIGGEIHGDPHLGNSLYRRNGEGSPEMALLDYGCILSVSDTQRRALLELILACRDGGEIPAFDCLVDLGFDAEKLSHIRESLPKACEIILKPFVDDTPFDAKSWNINAGFTDLLGEFKWWFRSAGPAELMLAIRAFHGVVSQLESLNSSLSWWEMLSEVLGSARIDEARENLKKRRAKPRDIEDEPEALAEKLCIRVTENGRQKIFLTMPGSSVYDLLNLIPEDVIDHIRKTGVEDLEAILQRVRDTHAAPQTLFEHERGEKHYRVWLK